MGHGYGLDADGEASHAALDAALDGIARTYHGRASHLYGFWTITMPFDYLGGLSLAVESRVGAPPQAWILQHADPGRAGLEPAGLGAAGRTAGRFQPAWLRPLMAHGYAGARTMGQEFLENLWGWQVTRPDLVQSWAWDEVKSVYFDDAHQLGLPRFLAEGHNAHAKAHMLAIMMVAAQRGATGAPTPTACVAWAASWPNWWRATACPAAATPARITPCGPGWPNNYPPTTPRRCKARSATRAAPTAAQAKRPPCPPPPCRAQPTRHPARRAPAGQRRRRPAPLNPPRWRELRLSRRRLRRV